MRACVIAFFAGLLAGWSADAAPVVDETYPYTGPAVPVADWVDPTINGNGKGFIRVVEAPAVRPASSNPTNNINVIQLSYLPDGINIHFQTPFGLGEAPAISWGIKTTALEHVSTGVTHTYNRTPPCSLVSVTQCSQFFHEVQLRGLESGTTYYYVIHAANGTTPSHLLNFTTALAAGDKQPFTIAVLNDMGYTNAGGTHREISKAASDGLAFAWHGGDISYADNWYYGILPCLSQWPTCYNGSETRLPGEDRVPDEYNVPLPEGETPNWGSPRGGDMSVIYESSWDLWQQWINAITTRVPYMVLPGNHEATCSEFDGPNHELSAYLDRNVTNSTATNSTFNYYSCPHSQRNYTAYQHRFRMPGSESGGAGNFWYSFDYGLAHFISFSSETDYPDSPESPFAKRLTGDETVPRQSETKVTDSGPFGAINGTLDDKESYEQYQWLAKDLAGVDRSKTPWVIAMSHRPMYSSGTSLYQKYMRAAFEDLFLRNGVDLYLSGHIHWYERVLPLGVNGTIDTESILDSNTYYTNPGVSMTHIINGMAGNVESHSVLPDSMETLPITQVLDTTHYGFSKLTVLNETVLTWSFIKGDDGTSGDDFTLIKRGPQSESTPSTGSTTLPTNIDSTVEQDDSHQKPLNN